MKQWVFFVILAPPEYLPIDDSLQCDGQVCYYPEKYVENGKEDFRQINITVKVRYVVHSNLLILPVNFLCWSLLANT